MQQGIGATATPTEHPGAPNPDEALDQDGNAQATPEEQAQYEAFVNQAIDITLDQQNQIEPQIVEDLRGKFDPQIAKMFGAVEPALTQSPVDSLAATGVLVTMLTEAMLSQQGNPVSHEIVYHAATEVIGHLAEIGEAAGVHNYSQDDIDNAFLRGLDIYRQSSPNVDQEALKQEFGQLIEADKQGQLDSVLPGASKLAAAAPKAQPA